MKSAIAATFKNLKILTRGAERGERHRVCILSMVATHARRGCGGGGFYWEDRNLFRQKNLQHACHSSFSQSPPTTAYLARSLACSHIVHPGP